MKSFMKPKICVFLVLVLFFEVFSLVTPANAKSISTPVISVVKYNYDAGIKVTIKKTKKANGYEVFICPTETIPLYEGYVNSFYVEGIKYDSLAGSWHDKGEYYLQADVKSTGKKKQYYYIKYMQPGTYKVRVRAYCDTNGNRIYSKYSKIKTITIGPDSVGNGFKTEYDFSGLKAGDEFEFGSYEIDGNLKNGYEPIKWKVLSKNDDNIFVISKFGLDILPYNKDYIEVTWENCTLRKWLNNKFYNAAFNESERNLIKEMAITNENNSIYGTNGGNVTTDKIIILSQQDLVNASYGFSTSYDEYDINRRCPATDYAFNSGLWVFDTYTNSEGTGSCFWWTRTPGNRNDYVTYVHDFGCMYSDGNTYDTGYVHCSHGIRPAMFIKLDNQKMKPAGNITMQQAMDEIADRLVGKYFTVSGDECDSCKGSFKSGHGCQNCLVSKIVKEEWYKKLFPEFKEVDVSHFPNIASGNKDSSFDNDGKSCFGFGCWAQWYVYSRVYGEQDFKGQHHLAKGKMTYEFLKESGAMPGDVIRKNGSHTMLLYSYDKNGYVVIDSNGHHNGNKNCVVAKVTMNYDKNKTCVISRPQIP